MMKKFKIYLILFTCVLFLSINSLITPYAEDLSTNSDPTEEVEEVISEEETLEIEEEQVEEIEEPKHTEESDILEEINEIESEVDVDESSSEFSHSFMEALVDPQITDYPVSTFAELKEALSKNNGIESIYLTADIVMTSGITVDSSKKQLVINGTYNGTRYTLTEMDGAAETGTIYISSSNTTYIKLMALNIQGKNYYGPVNVADGISNNVTIEYQDIYYKGPQLTHNIYGKAIYNGVTIEIQKTGSSAAQEVGEIGEVEFYGTNSIVHGTNNGNYIFYFYRNGSMVFNENASLTVNASGNPFMTGGTIDFHLKEGSTVNYISSNVKFASDSNNIGNLILEANTTMDLSFNGSAAYSYGLRVSGSATIGPNATLAITSNGSVGESIIYGPTSVWNINGGNVIIKQNNSVTSRLAQLGRVNINSGNFEFQVTGNMLYGLYLTNGMLIGTNGSYSMQANKVSGYNFQAAGTTSTDGIIVKGKFKVDIKSSTAAYGVASAMPILIQENAVFQVAVQEGGPSTALIYFSSANGYIDFNNPKNVYLYSKSTRLIYYLASKQFNMQATRINYWLTPKEYSIAGTLQDYPLYYWYKESGDPLWIHMQMSSGAAGNITSSDSNQIDGDGSSGWPGSLFNPTNMRVLSMGYIEISQYAYEASNNRVFGTTEPNVTIQISYNGQEVVTRSDSSGNFSYQFTAGEITVGSEIQLLFNLDFLYETRSITIMEEGSLEFKYVPSQLQFEIGDIPSETTLIEREVDNWAIQITDDRTTKGNWKLFAKVAAAMKADDATIPNLEEALIFIDENGNPHDLFAQEVLIYDSTSGESEATISWAVNKGVLLKAIPGNIFSNVRYSTTIEWILQDAP